MKRVRGPNGRFGKEINAEVAELPGVADAVGLCTLLARIHRRLLKPRTGHHDARRVNAHRTTNRM